MSYTQKQKRYADGSVRATWINDETKREVDSVHYYGPEMCEAGMDDNGTPLYRWAVITRGYGVYLLVPGEQMSNGDTQRAGRWLNIAPGKTAERIALAWVQGQD
jgi:hypothetical protein